jgi:predicted membrane metal-binding protein
VFIQLIFAIFVGVLISFFFKDLSYLSTVTHDFCLNKAPQSEYRIIYQAILCGRKISTSSYFAQLSTLGIVHVIVVSGAHLIILLQLIQTITLNKISKIILIFLLFLFVLCCQAQAPVFRAWIFLLIKYFSDRLKLFNSKSFNILLSVVICLSIEPANFFSLSLPMSWLACLAILKGSNIFIQSALCYIFILPLLMGFQILHPWTIAINTLITPVICLILFPMTALSFIFPPLTPFSDQIWSWLFIFSSKVSPLLKIYKVYSLQTKAFYIWLYPLIINLHFIFSKKSPNKNE